MIARCNDENHKWHKCYGGRGIKVCKEWENDFTAFAEWAQKSGYADNLSIDRIENNKGYTPENCRWVDMETQNRNRRDNIIVKYNGRNMCLTDAARLSGIKRCTLETRYKKGDRQERLFRPVKKK